MWTCISLERKTELVFVFGRGLEGGLTADRYITDILLDHIVPYARFFSDNFIILHDIERPMLGTREFLSEIEIHTMNWPALSTQHEYH
jgi:hypothetical protein